MPPGKVGYAFAREEINITTWVERMMVHAGAYSNRDWQELGRSPMSMRKNLKLLYKSQPMVRSLFLVRRGIRLKLKQTVQKILLSIDQDPASKRVLKKYYKVMKYDFIKGEAKKSLGEARKLYYLVRDQFK